MNEEEGPQIATVEAFTLAEQRIKDLNTKLTEAIKEKKSTKVTLEGVERQAQTQHQQLRQTEDQLTTTKEQIGALKKKLEEAEEATAKAKQKGYEVRVAKTEERMLPLGVEWSIKPSWDGCFLHTKEGRKCFLSPSPPSSRSF